MVLIQSIAGEEWWEDVTIAMLENARKKLRALVKLIEKGKKNVVYTDFEDELGIETTVDLPEVVAGMNMAKFRDKARQFLKAHESHLSLQRLRRNQPLTAADLSELERMLVEAGGPRSSSIKPKSRATAWAFSSARWSVWTAKQPSKPSANSSPAPRSHPTRLSSLTWWCNT